MEEAFPRTLPAVTCPVLVIQGEQDEYGTLRQVKAIAEGVPVPVETLLWPTAGMRTTGGSPEEMLVSIVRFVRPLARR